MSGIETELDTELEIGELKIDGNYQLTFVIEEGETSEADVGQYNLDLRLYDDAGEGVYNLMLVIRSTGSESGAADSEQTEMPGESD